jgi:AcrR family transcriptional regulator
MAQRAPYHSPLRRDQAAGTRARIVDACVAVMRDGRELTYSAVAAEAGVQERTVYRYFPTKPDLECAFREWMIENVTSAHLSAGTADELIAVMREWFASFDRDATLIRAMLRSPDGLDMRRREERRIQDMFRACVDAAVPGAPDDVAARAAAALLVLSSSTTWDMLRSFKNMDATAAADVVELAIRSLLDGLRMRFGHVDGRAE